MPRAEVERLARESGMVQRRRKVDPVAMLWTVVLGFGTGRERTLAGLRRTYQRVTGRSLVPSSFYDRFTKELARMFKAVLGELMAKLEAIEPRYDGVLEGFRDVLVADATVVKLHALLAGRYPGTRTNSSPAAAKLHLVMSVRGGGAKKVKVTGERASDHRTLRMGPWVEGRLLLFDLGYFRYQLFDCIDRNGGYFITRLATNANPQIVATHCVHRGRSIDLEGKRLNEVAARLKREVLDVEVEVRFERRVYAGVKRSARRRLRLIGVRLPESTEYRFYLTNIEPEGLDAMSVAQAYAARWQVELIFKELKSHYRLDELPTSKGHIVETLLLGAVITLLVSRRLLDSVRHRLRGTGWQIPEQRWAAILAAAAAAILDVLLLPLAASKTIARRLEPMLLHEAADPNRKRKLLVQRVEFGLAWS
jgi:IS4 transposase